MKGKTGQALDDIVKQIRCQHCGRKVRFIREYPVEKLDDKRTRQVFTVKCKTKICGFEQEFEIQTTETSNPLKQKGDKS